MSRRTNRMETELLTQFYDALWQEALEYFKTGKVRIDPYLPDRSNDRRLGFTLIARPSQQVIQRIGRFCKSLRRSPLTNIFIVLKSFMSPSFPSLQRQNTTNPISQSFPCIALSFKQYCRIQNLSRLPFTE